MSTFSLILCLSFRLMVYLQIALEEKRLPSLRITELQKNPKSYQWFREVATFHGQRHGARLQFLVEELALGTTERHRGRPVVAPVVAVALPRILVEARQSANARELMVDAVGPHELRGPIHADQAGRPTAGHALRRTHRRWWQRLGGHGNLHAAGGVSHRLPLHLSVKNGAKNRFLVNLG